MTGACLEAYQHRRRALASERLSQNGQQALAALRLPLSKESQLHGMLGRCRT